MSLNNFSNHTAYKDINKAYQEVFNLISNDNIDPTEAVIKVAKDMNLGMQKTQRVAETVNTTLTLSHFRNHPEKKGENFSIAHTKDILDELGATFSKAAEQEDTSGLFIAKAKKSLEFSNYLKRKDMTAVGSNLLKVASETDFSNLAPAVIEDSVEEKMASLEVEIGYLSDIYHNSCYNLENLLKKASLLFSRIDAPDALEFMKYAQFNYPNDQVIIKEFLNYIDKNSSNFIIKSANMLEATQVIFGNPEATQMIEDYIRESKMIIHSRVQMNNKYAEYEECEESKKKDLKK